MVWASPERRPRILRRGVLWVTARRFAARDDARGARTRKWPSELNGASGNSNAIAGADRKTCAGFRTSTAPRHR
jgi:hypothetical protein